MQLLASLLLPVQLLLMLQMPATRPQQHQRQQRWRPLPPADRAGECGSEFNDIQSKWLLSDMVVRATWRSSDESTPTSSGVYNVTLTVVEQLKPWARDLTGQRVTVGTFNRMQNRRQKVQERMTCVPYHLQRGKRGHVFFLNRTADPAFFRHAFLPVKFKRRMKVKFSRLQCNPMRACPTPPELLQETRKSVKGDREKGRVALRLVCRARGLPQPRPLWLKDGARLAPAKGVVGQFRNRNRAIISRLIVKNAAASDAGNYTCVFRNVRGSVSSSIVVTAEDLQLPMGQQTSTPRSPPSLPYLCDYRNYTYCHHGGTCFVNRVTNEPTCKCPPEFNGLYCESLNIEFAYREHIRKGNRDSWLQCVNPGVEFCTLITARL